MNKKQFCHFFLLVTILYLFPIKSLYSQQHELTFSVNVSNSINPYAENSAKHENFSKSVAPSGDFGVEYYRRVHPNYFVYGSLRIIGTAASVKYISYPRPDCPGCKRVQTVNVGGLDDTGLQLGMGRTMAKYKNKQIDLLGGVLIRYIYKNYPGTLQVGQCNDPGCFSGISEFEYSLKGTIHSSLFVMTSWAFAHTKNEKYRFRLNLTYTHGLQPIYYTNSTLVSDDGSRTDNFTLNNRGSYVGIGVSMGWLKS